MLGSGVVFRKRRAEEHSCRSQKSSADLVLIDGKPRVGSYCLTPFQILGLAILNPRGLALARVVWLKHHNAMKCCM